MRHLLTAAVLIAATGLAGCGYMPVPPDPIRYVTSPAEVSTCRKLGGVGFARTDGQGPYNFGDLTVPAPAYLAPAYPPERVGYGLPSGEIVGRNFAVRIEVMRDGALALGATDLLLSRRIYRDWSYVEGIAYACARRTVGF